VHTADTNGSVVDPDPAHAYAVDAIMGRPRVSPLTVDDCCAGEPGGCFACSDDDQNVLYAFDVVFFYLDRPFEGVAPMNFVARISKIDPTTRTYDIDPSQWPNSILAIVVGVGSGQTEGWGRRRYGLNTVIDRGW
jgi:hypothetical protein